MTTGLTIPIRVLHTLHTYLATVENWIYPQIACVPKTETAVLCGSSTNSSEFPMVGRPFFFTRARQRRIRVLGPTSGFITFTNEPRHSHSAGSEVAARDRARSLWDAWVGILGPSEAPTRSLDNYLLRC